MHVHNLGVCILELQKYLVLGMKYASKARCQKHPEGGGTSFLGGVQSIFMIFRGVVTILGIFRGVRSIFLVFNPLKPDVWERSVLPGGKSMKECLENKTL